MVEDQGMVAAGSRDSRRVVPVIKALTLAGGGANGEAAACQVERMTKAGAGPWSVYSGESIGAANAYLIALGGAADVASEWRGIYQQAIYRGGGFLDKVAVAIGKREGIYDMSPSIATIAKLANGRRLPAGLRVIVNVTDLKTGAMVENVLTRDTIPSSCVELVYQSCLVPIAHGARDGRWADGGISATAPLGPVVAAGASDVDVVLLDQIGYAPWSPTPKALDQGGRAIDILRDNAFFNDLQGTILRNKIAAGPVGHGFRKVSATFHIPITPLPDWMDFSPRAKAVRRNAGFTRMDIDSVYAELQANRRRALAQSTGGLAA